MEIRTPAPPPFGAHTATGTTRMLPVPLGRTWPLLPLAPLAVVVVGLAVAACIGLFGLDHLSRASDDHAADRADLFATTLAARIRPLRERDRLEALQLAARRTGAEYLVLTRDGEVTLDASLGGADRGALRDVVRAQRGEAITGQGRTRFAVSPVDIAPASHFLVAFVREPAAPEGAPAMLRALLALTTLLVGIATVVAYAVVRDANRDVDFVARRVRDMLHVQSEPTGEAVPVRAIDEVGVLTIAFNDLVGRFAAAEQSYREDLERVRSADRDRAAFLAAVSHELRSPLNAILGFADILMTEVDGPLTPSQREEVEQIRGSGQHLLDLITDILDFSALESGQLKLSRTRVELYALAAEVVREASGLVGSRPIAVRIEGDPTVLAHADAKRTRQILTNLVANAVKFTVEGEVVVEVAREGRYARVSVRDSGPGISAAERMMIFEEYKQAKEERLRRRGTGLGLAIARRLVLMHGGSIQVESEIGHGSTFKCLLPQWNDQAPPRTSDLWQLATGA